MHQFANFCFIFIFIVSVTAKIAAMATTNSNCIRLDDARTQNNKNTFVVCHEQTLQIMQSYLVLLSCNMFIAYV